MRTEEFGELALQNIASGRTHAAQAHAVIERIFGNVDAEHLACVAHNAGTQNEDVQIHAIFAGIGAVSRRARRVGPLALGQHAGIEVIHHIEARAAHHSLILCSID